MASPQTTLAQEAGWALDGTWRMLLGRREARDFFDSSQRGLAGSFIPLLLAGVMLVGFLGLGSAGEGGGSAVMQIFIAGVIVTLRYLTLRLILPRLDALHAFRPYMVASNWANAIAIVMIVVLTFASAFIGAILLGPASGAALADFVLILWAATAFALLVVEINILRIVVGLKAGEVVLVLSAQLFTVLAGLALIGRML